MRGHHPEDETALRNHHTTSVADDIELAYLVRGDGGRTLVVPSATWIAEDLGDLGPSHAVVFYDLRGRGRSSAVLEESRIGLEQDLADLEALRVALGRERISLLGWSYHGLLAARYALLHPGRVERLVLVGPSAPRQEPHFHDFLDRFARRLDPDVLMELEGLRRARTKETDPLRWCHAVHGAFFRGYVTDPRALERMRSDPCVEPNLDADRVNDFARRGIERLGDYDWREEFRALDVPTLIVHGEDDPVPLEGSREWEACLPDARLVVMPGVAHMPWLEAPAEFEATVRAFLET